VAGISSALNIFDKFIGVAKELGKLPALVMPQYQEAAKDIYKISQKLLTANENLSRWIHRFTYFDFRQNNARTEFMNLTQEYKSMKSGQEYQLLKFSCSDIGAIYYQNIESKIGEWIANEKKRKEVKQIFDSLSNADNDMVVFTYEHVMDKLDKFVDKAEQNVDSGNMDSAEQDRLKFKAEFKEVTDRLEKFSGELADLVIQFAGMAKIPVTLNTS
jgi:archaellum component FlaC